MRSHKNNQIVVLKNNEGLPLRFMQSQTSKMLLVQNKITKRIELIDELTDYNETYNLIQKIDLSHSNTIQIKNIGSVSVYENEHISHDAKLTLVNENILPFWIKRSSYTNGAIALLLIILSFIIPKAKINDEIKPIESIVQIQLNPEVKKINTPVKSKPSTTPIQKNVKTAKITKVKPRTNKSKPLLVKKVTKPRVNQKGPAPKEFQRLSTLSVLSQALKGSRQGSGSGLKLSGGASGGQGHVAGVGKGNGTHGHGNDSGGGYAQALYGKGLIAGQVGSGSGGYGSGWGEGRRGSGSFGTKGKGGGHQGYGTSKIGAGSAVFTYPLREDTMVEGGLDREAVDLVVMRNIGQITYCYEVGLQKKSNLRGRVLVDFTINPHGNVSAVSIAGSSLRSPQVENCMMNKVKGWKFPRPVGGVNVEVNYPFALQRVSQN